MTMLPKYGNKPIEITLGQLITLTKPGKPRLKDGTSDLYKISRSMVGTSLEVLRAI